MDNPFKKESNLSSNAGFWIGLLGGLALFSTVGFVLMLVLFFSSDKENLKTVNNNQAANTQATQQTGDKTISKTDIQSLFKLDGIKFGKSSAKNLFIEFSDPSCPYCQIAAGKNSALNNSAGSRFKLVSDGGTYLSPVQEMKKLVDSGDAGFMYFYTNGHGSGELAAQAFYCANEKGKFWEVHDLIMSSAGYQLMNSEENSGNRLKAETLAAFLKPAIAEAFMKECLSSGKYAQMIARDASIAADFGVQGTPAFFANTQLFAGAYSFSDMKSALSK